MHIPGSYDQIDAAGLGPQLGCGDHGVQSSEPSSQNLEQVYQLLPILHRLYAASQSWLCIGHATHSPPPKSGFLGQHLRHC